MGARRVHRLAPPSYRTPAPRTPESAACRTVPRGAPCRGCLLPPAGERGAGPTARLGRDGGGEARSELAEDRTAPAAGNVEPGTGAVPLGAGRVGVVPVGDVVEAVAGVGHGVGGVLDASQAGTQD